MPRPIVEIHQKILAPVATPTDPEQSVVIVGLHCADRSNTLLGTYSANPEDFVVDAAGTADFQVDEPGVIINSDIDLGNHIVEGDLSCTLKNIKRSVGSKTTVTNFSAYGALLGGRQAQLDSSFSSPINTSSKEYFLHVKPEDSLRNIIKVSSGSGSLNLLTGACSGNPSIATTSIADISNLANNTTLIKLGGHGALTFKAISRSSDKMYIYGTTKAAEDLLRDSDSVLDNVAISVNTSGQFMEVPGFLFSVEAAETQVIQLDSFDPISKVAVLTSNINFCALQADSRAAVSVVSYSDVNSSEVISELDSSLPLEVESQASGDAVFKLKLARLFSEGVVACDVFANYTVALTSYSDKLYDVNSVSVDLLGKPSLSNQLCLAAKLALVNAGTTSIKVLALDLTPAVGESVPKTLAKAYLDALEIINSDPDVYAVCPLTSSIQVLYAYKLSAEAMSSPAKGKFRIVLGTSEGAPLVDFIVGTDKTPEESGIASNGIITDETKNFRSVASKVMEGDLIICTDSLGNVVSGTIDSTTVLSLSITWDANTEPADGAVSYYVFRDISGPSGKSRQLELLDNLGKSLNSNRLLMVFPGVCSISVDGVEYSNVSAIFLTAALAGIVAGVEPHRPKNSINLAGVTGLSGSNIGRFSDDEIDSISDSGFFVFIQDNATSAPYCVHQVMTKYNTSKGVQELTELSVINNFDFVARFFKRTVEPFVGTYNITSDTLGLIRASLDSAIGTLRLRVRPQIGAPLLAGSVDLVRQASYDSGTVESKVTVILPKVLNKIVLEIVSA